jgi:alpha-tubulin suppressor-like RCC1 family protein
MSARLGRFLALPCNEIGRICLCLGNNDYGQLGDGTTTQRTAPVVVSGLSGVEKMDAGYCYSLVLKTDGTVMSGETTTMVKWATARIYAKHRQFR